MRRTNTDEDFRRLTRRYTASQEDLRREREKTAAAEADLARMAARYAEDVASYEGEIQSLRSLVPDRGEGCSRGHRK
jgi:hypothetical protein